ncbi:MAG: thiamine-phosphate kinase [Mariprofundaceae bacterium]
MAESEFELIEKAFRSQCRFTHPYTRIPNGDDASVHCFSSDMELVVSTDCFVSGIHWPEDFPLPDAGDKAIGAALSDLAAMGAEAAWIWLGIQAVSSAEAVAVGQGVSIAVNRYQLELAGGDTTRSSVNAISVTVGGLVPVGTAMRRDTAKVGDDIWLLGNPGSASFGFDQWRRGIRDGIYIDRFRRALPLLHEGAGLRQAGVRCCIDVSDGLLQDAGHCAEKSGVGMHLRLDAIADYHLLLKSVPADEAQDYILTGGEDYALLFTAPVSLRPELHQFASQIGSCELGKGMRVSLDNKPVKLRRRGWDHFG